MSIVEGELEATTATRDELKINMLSHMNNHDISITPRLSLNEDLSDDSSRMEISETSLLDGDIDTKLEDILNSSDTNALLDTLKLKFSSESEHLDLAGDELIKVTETTLKSADILEELPLFQHSLLNQEIIEGETRLSTPEKLNEKENEYIHNKTTLSPETDDLSPISRKMQQFQNTKSRIPLPTIRPTAIRRSKRLIEHHTETRDICSPKKITGILKPAIKQGKPILNMLVDSSSGQLNEATKYATEINAANCEGIPIPTTPNELVTIPVNGSRKAAKKTALIRAHRIEAIEKKKVTMQVGFYTQAQHRKYFSLTSPNKIQKATTETAAKKKKLRWANELEW